MGSVGNQYDLVNKAKGESKYTDFNGASGARKWFKNPKMSNYQDWVDNQLTPEERSAVKDYTGSSYGSINNALYNKPWDELTESQRENLANIYNGISKFELNKGINVTRSTDFQIFGAPKGAKMTVDDVNNFLNGTKGVVQNDAFMSFSADSNHGVSIAGSGLYIHLAVPPSKGAGAYVDPISYNTGENEYILNNNAVMKFDTSKTYADSSGRVHVYGQWLGQAQSQTISKNSKSKLKKKK